MHETKICEVCRVTFECKVGDVINCQCFRVALTEKETEYLRRNFSDCLCVACIQKIKVRIRGNL